MNVARRLSLILMTFDWSICLSSSRAYVLGAKQIFIWLCMSIPVHERPTCLCKKCCEKQLSIGTAPKVLQRCQYVEVESNSLCLLPAPLQRRCIVVWREDTCEPISQSIVTILSNCVTLSWAQKSRSGYLRVTAHAARPYFHTFKCSQTAV